MHTRLCNDAITYATERPRWSFNSSRGRVSTVGGSWSGWGCHSVCWSVGLLAWGEGARGARPLSIYHPPSQLSLSDSSFSFSLFSRVVHPLPWPLARYLSPPISLSFLLFRSTKVRTVLWKEGGGQRGLHYSVRERERESEREVVIK